MTARLKSRGGNLVRTKRFKALNAQRPRCQVYAVGKDDVTRLVAQAGATVIAGVVPADHPGLVESVLEGAKLAF